MKVLIATAIWPRRAHSINAPPVVTFELAMALAAQPGVIVSVLKLTRADEPPPVAEDAAGRAASASAGIEVVELRLPPAPARRWFPVVLAQPRLEDFGRRWYSATGPMRLWPRKRPMS